jgi:hypothetical protein
MMKELFKKLSIATAFSFDAVTSLGDEGTRYRQVEKKGIAAREETWGIQCIFGPDSTLQISDLEGKAKETRHVDRAKTKQEYIDRAMDEFGADFCNTADKSDARSKGICLAVLKGMPPALSLNRAKKVYILIQSQVRPNVS